MPIWNDWRAQRDFYAWLRTHMQDEREEQIRDLAKKYAEGNLGSHNRSVLTFGPLTHGYVSPNMPMTTTMNFNDVTLDIDPGIPGFARQMLAEMAIREQLDLCNEPGDD